MENSDAPQTDEVLEKKSQRPQINLTRLLPHQTAYTLALDNEFREYAFNEERAPENKNNFRQKCDQEYE